MNIYEKYSEAIYGTKEFLLYNLLTAYFNQDAEDFEAALFEYIGDYKNAEILLTKEAIDEFLYNEEFSQDQKREFISSMNSYWCEPDEAFEWLEKVKLFLINHVS